MEDYLETLVMSAEELTPKIRQSIYIEMAHGINVSNLAVALASELRESRIFCQDIAIAGLLHDIGKLRLSKYLYSKTNDTLMVEQMRYVREHSTFGRDILKEKGYKQEILEAVYSHHENFDGSGYPDRLRGEAIPKMARILRTCDVFAALTSDRSYRRAFDNETAVEMMIDEVTSYDMEVILAFQRLYHSDKFDRLDQLTTEVTDLQKIHLPRFIEEEVSLHTPQQFE